jgi:hypothetical protein
MGESGAHERFLSSKIAEALLEVRDVGPAVNTIPTVPARQPLGSTAGRKIHFG